MTDAEKAQRTLERIYGPSEPTAAPPRNPHGFRAVANNGVSYELTCKCGQLWAGRNKTTLLACFDAHITLYEDGD